MSEKYSLGFVINNVLKDFCCYKINDVLIFLCYFNFIENCVTN